MAGVKNFWEFFDDFHGVGTFVAAAGLDQWLITDTSSAGTPTYTRLDHGTSAGASGVARLLLESTSEVQNVCLSFGDKLCFPITDRLIFETRIKTVATLDSATSIAWGLTGDRNDAIDSVAQAMIFRVIGNNTLVCESDDGTTDKDDVATGLTLADTYKVFRVDAQDVTNVKFSVNGTRVAKTTTFDMSAYSGCLQPFFQIQKTADTNTDNLDIDYVYVSGRRIN
jgi:hypothetical protein